MYSPIISNIGEIELLSKINRADVMSYMGTRLCATILGPLLAIYAVTELLLERTHTSSVCSSTWLCPLEFSPQRLFELRHEVSSNKSGRALADLIRAVRLDSGSAYAWADLGEAYLTLQRTDLAISCFQHALSQGPNSPAILVRAANLYFALGDPAKVMLYFKQALDQPDSGDYYAPAFLSYTRMGIPVTALLEHGVPATAPAGQAFLRFLMAAGRVSDSQTAWDWLSRRCLLDDGLAGEYLVFLIGNRREGNAAQSWATANTAITPGYRLRNWVYNERFETDFRPTPFDWHIASSDDVQVSRSQAEAHDGKWSLELAFAGDSNVDFHGAFQETVLTPGRWHLQAFVKTQKLTTDQGISLRILDAAQSTRLDIRTDQLAGDRDWTKVEQSFVVPPETAIIRLEVMRQPSLKIDNKIAGKAWVDSLELTPMPGPSRFR